MITLEERVQKIKNELEHLFHLNITGNDFIENKDTNCIVYQDDENILKANAYCVGYRTLQLLFNMSQEYHFKITILNGFPAGFSLAFTII